MKGFSAPVQHKEALTEIEKTRLKVYFKDVLDSENIDKPQSFCWFNVAWHFGFRMGKFLKC